MSKEVLIALTGGGTAGHVMPHLAMLEDYSKRGWKVIYIGSNGIEKELIKDTQVPFYTIASGKLRRYFSWQNLWDVFKVSMGILQATMLLARHRPQVIFSKGGFVSVPVALGAWILRIPVVSHESDMTPGLATKIITRFATRIFYSFPDTGKYLPRTKAELVGLPIREDLFQGNRREGIRLCGFQEEDARPVIMVMGGSLGAKKINDTFLECLPELVKKFRVIHITGKGKVIDFNDPGYRGFEYVKSDLKHLFAATDLVVARAGANSIFEFLALNKPMLLIPLKGGSRGDQIDNAENFARQGWANVLTEDDLNAKSLAQAIERLQDGSERMRQQQRQANLSNARQILLDRLSGIVSR